jgi:hypothetical protein
MATVLYNKTTKEIVGGPYVNGYLVDGMPGEIQLPFIELTIIENDPPEYNPLIQKLISEWEVKTFKKTRTMVWSVIDKSQQELIEEEEASNNLADSLLDNRLLKRLLKRLLDQVSDTEALEFKEAFCVFRPNKNYITGERLLFKGNLYKVLEDHISERTNKPDTDTTRYSLLNR